MSSEFEIALGEPSHEGSGETCTVSVRVPPDLRFFEGHFPGHPIVPGIAQLATLVYEPAIGVWPDLPAPRAVKRLKFLEALGPGDTLEVRLDRTGDKLRFAIYRGETLCSRGVLTF